MLKRTCITAMAFAAALGAADPAREQKIQKAVDLMETKGDPVAALPLLEDATRSRDRAVAARALLFLGQAQEVQGKDRARATYERITKDFADQREVVAKARQRLASLTPSPGKVFTGLTARQIWKGPEVDSEGVPTLDGRLYSMVHWDTGDLAVRDIASGEIKRLMLKKSWQESSDYAEWPLLSPDQRQIVHAWFDTEQANYELRVVGTDPGGKPRVLIRNREFNYYMPAGWSLDGKSILVHMWKRDRTSEIAWVSALDGSFRILKNFEWRSPSSVSLSPDGRYIAYDVFERINGIDRDIYVIAADGRSEAALVKNPGSDSCPLWTPDGRHIVFTSTRTGSNSLWSIAVLNGKAEGTPQLLKPDVGRIFPRGFVRSGTLYYSQDKADENIYLANMDAATGRLRGGIAPITDTYVGLNRSVAFSPDGKRVAYLSNRAHVRFGPGAFTVVVRTLDTGEERAYSTDLGLTPRVVWFPDGRRLLLPARDAKSGVSLYSLDVNSGDVRLIVKPEQPINPNVNIGRDGRTALVTAVDQASRIATLDALDLQTGERKTLYKTPGRGFINGVSVSPDGATLAIIMNSGVGPKSIARIGTMPLNGGEFRELVIETNANDIRPYAGIAWSPDGRYLYYARVLKREDFQLWRIRATGGTPEPTGVQGRQVRQMSVAADGRIAFTAGQPNESEIWALDNLLPTLKASR